MTTAHCPLAGVLGARLRQSRTALTARWLERIAARVSVAPNRVFPSDDLLDHVPILLDGVADYLADPAEAIAADAAVLAKASELGALRHAQGFDAYEILKEYEILGGILLSFLSEIADEIEEPCSRGELLACAQRVFQAVALIQEATATQYLQRMQEKLAEREQRLRSFNRSLAHEFRNRIGAAMGAGEMLGEMTGLSDESRQRLAGVVVRSTHEMNTVLNNLLELSRIHVDSRSQRHVRLREAVRETSRQLRDMAEARGVELRISPELPEIEVPAAAVELCLANLLSNAIKYANPERHDRWIEVDGSLEPGTGEIGSEVVVTIRDNGLGVPFEMREHIFERFVRAHEQVAKAVEGTGLGLSIVRETIDDAGGRLWAEFPDEGSIFAFSLPCRRLADLIAAAGGASTGERTDEARAS